MFRKGIEDLPGLAMVVLIGGIIIALFMFITYFSSTGVVKNVIGIKGGVNYLIEIDDKGSKALTISSLNPKGHSVMEVLGTVIAEGENREIARNLQIIEEIVENKKVKEKGFQGILVKDGSGNVIYSIGNPIDGLGFTVPLPGGNIGEIEVS